MWKRLASRNLKALAGEFPAILLLGARQVGKTTLARTTFPRIPYCDLERPDLRALFSSDPRFQIQNRAGPGLILDEAQTVPEVFPALRGLIDENRRANGRYIILGSAQPNLVRGVSESLAGRVGVWELDPLTAGEIAHGPEAHVWTDAWLRAVFLMRSTATSAPGGNRSSAPTSNATCPRWVWPPIPCSCGAC